MLLFWAEWHQPCHILRDQLSELAKIHKELRLTWVIHHQSINLFHSAIRTKRKLLQSWTNSTSTRCPPWPSSTLTRPAQSSLKTLRLPACSSCARCRTSSTRSGSARSSSRPSARLRTWSPPSLSSSCSSRARPSSPSASSPANSSRRSALTAIGSGRSTYSRMSVSGSGSSSTQSGPRSHRCS